MSTSSLRILYALVTYAVLSMGFTNAEAQTNFRAFSFWLDLKQEPKQFGDALVDVLKSNEGRVILSGIATYFGVPPTMVGGAGLIAGSIRSSGEDHYIDVPFDAGFVFCNGRVAEEVSHIGRGATSIAGSPNKLGIYAWLQRRGFTKGSSLIKVRVEVLTVRQNLQQQYLERGKCIPFETRIYDKEWG